MKKLLKGGVIVGASGCRKADLLIDGERIEAVGEALSCPEAEEIDVSGKLLFFRYGYSVAVFPQYVCRGSYRLHILRFAYPAHGSKTECQHFSAVIRPSFSFP